MEIRTLRYFLEIAREGSMTRAGERLHVSQPSLSRQMAALEDELGTKLFRRGRTTMTLTQEGVLLRERAEAIVGLADKTEEEFAALGGDAIAGDVRIGCAESYLVSYLGRAIMEARHAAPGLRFHITSGDTSVVLDRLGRGLLDLAFIVEPPDLARFNYLEVPGTDSWGLIVPNDHPLAGQKFVGPEDLIGLELLCSEQSLVHDLPRWCGEMADSLNIIGTVNLAYNGSVLVKEGVGCMLAFDKLVDTRPGSGLTFLPLQPPLETRMYAVWLKRQHLTPVTEHLLAALREELADNGDGGRDNGDVAYCPSP